MMTMMTRMTRAAKVSSVDLQLRLLTRGEAERVVRRRRKDRVDLPWAEGYPLDGDSRACASYVSHLPLTGGSAGHDAFGYYQIVEAGVVIGGIGFHGRPRQGVVEIGYGIVPSARERGVATAALRMIIGLAAQFDGVRQVVGRTSEDNVASQRVMLGAGMRFAGRDPEFLHYQLDLE
jgi:RimJ/RimL family protein N-acetyltransferase